MLFLANSGLRVGEAREMLWSDIKFDVAVEGSDSVIAEVRVSKATKKGGSTFCADTAKCKQSAKTLA